MKLPEFTSTNGYQLTSSQLLIYLLVTQYWEGDNTHEIQLRTGIIAHAVVRELGRIIEEYPELPESDKKKLYAFGEALGALEG